MAVVVLVPYGLTVLNLLSPRGTDLKAFLWGTLAIGLAFAFIYLGGVAADTRADAGRALALRDGGSSYRTGHVLLYSKGISVSAMDPDAEANRGSWGDLQDHPMAVAVAGDQTRTELRQYVQPAESPFAGAVFTVRVYRIAPGDSSARELAESLATAP